MQTPPQHFHLISSTHDIQNSVVSWCGSHLRPNWVFLHFSNELRGKISSNVECTYVNSVLYSSVLITDWSNDKNIQSNGAAPRTLTAAVKNEATWQQLWRFYWDAATLSDVQMEALRSTHLDIICPTNSHDPTEPVTDSVKTFSIS